MNWDHRDNLEMLDNFESIFYLERKDGIVYLSNFDSFYVFLRRDFVSMLTVIRYSSSTYYSPQTVFFCNPFSGVKSKVPIPRCRKWGCVTISSAYRLSPE